ncbi:TRM11 family SAM-dependent methyltransferase [[Clostridium] polysaccharolyticum]|uniref:Putative RNA methylase family UPF0020 n=1 Tax=[Clostridium] polysaccharolyticum TaxID=29364 RepID=A0A1H9YPH8_9FIRM|nr:methyltransferase domain-containing protein [[Clostridium] polysaccharolyticum]SES70382.1 Putative RNA methylase family UPF0020 [[Clostridium] polysaccharolyticum]
MIRETFDAIVKGENVRQNLSILKQELKEGNNKHALLFHIGSQYNDMFTGLLNHEDAKTRKNAALVMGELGIQDFLEPLYQAYQSETKLFVKSSYLVAIQELDYRSIMPQLKERLKELSEAEFSEENRKHMREEMRAIFNLVATMEGVKGHAFTGEHLPADIILLTNRNHIGVTMEQLPEGTRARAFSAGIQAKASSLEEVLPIRTYSELLFLVPGVLSCPMDVEGAAQKAVSPKLLAFLKERHDGEVPFYFRIELKSKMEPGKKAAFAKKLSSAIEQKSQRKLINTTSNYEIEIRFVENKDGNFNVLLKLFTLKDSRFQYRKEAVAASIRPVNAALTVALTKKYQKEGAQVLDPFCGVGTMLNERHKVTKADTMYGIDIFGDAIKKARKNTENARQIVHYINRDFFDFRHDYLFDEIITDMPFAMGRISKEEIKQIYIQFFHKIKQHLAKDAVIILYSHDKGLVRKYAPANGFKVIEEYEISVKEGTYVYVIK